MLLLLWLLVILVPCSATALCATSRQQTASTGETVRAAAAEACTYPTQTCCAPHSYDTVPLRGNAPLVLQQQQQRQPCMAWRCCCCIPASCISAQHPLRMPAACMCACSLQQKPTGSRARDHCNGHPSHYWNSLRKAARKGSSSAALLQQEFSNNSSTLSTNWTLPGSSSNHNRRPSSVRPSATPCAERMLMPAWWLSPQHAGRQDCSTPAPAVCLQQACAAGARQEVVQAVSMLAAARACCCASAAGSLPGLLRMVWTALLRPSSSRLTL